MCIFLGRAPLPKALAAVFCGFGLAFAALAAGKLAVYVVLYGLTPRRVIAGWFLGVLAVWCVLALVRVFRAIPAAHIAILVLAVSFTVLACVNMKQRIINANLARVEAGIDEEPGLGRAVGVRVQGGTVGEEFIPPGSCAADFMVNIIEL